ncbi:VTT domain-containing protein [Methanobrevibacter sp. TMH8]|uniref:DedA family protein n=1 Tax=Methanobrevibacter sp. TMH8 TaxID=2848611 RepID=UPI001CCE374C|nr:VTT domain-containing protein [Methanobrevibacter sp. TMH8]MBZ9571233.1 VTT domain-containing protein [Methanobrevibacter sp. TMH8]
MLESITSLLQTFFIDYGAIGVFLGSIIEEIIAPIPSTIIILGSSFFILEGQSIGLNSVLNLIFSVSLPAALGMSIGSLFIYGLCYYIGKPFISKWGKYLAIRWEDIEKTDEKFQEQTNDELILFGVRAIPIIPSVAISAFCGIIRYDLKKYIIITFIGGLVRATILGFLGWQFGNFYQEIAGQISFLEEVAVIAIVIGIVGYILYKKLKSKKSE